MFAKTENSHLGKDIGFYQYSSQKQDQNADKKTYALRFLTWSILIYIAYALLVPALPLIAADQGAISDQLRDLKSSDVAVRRRAAIRLEGVVDLSPEILPLLRAALNDPDGDVAFHLATALINAGAKALRQIDQALRDPDEGVRRRMAGALAVAKRIEPETAPFLIAAFRDTNPDVSASAARAFTKIGVSSLPLLQTALHDKDPRLRRGACMATGDIGPSARSNLQDLLRALSDFEPSVRYEAAFALARIDPGLDQPLVVLNEALNDPDWLVRLNACNALILLQQRGRVAIPSLLQHVVTDPDNAIRGIAARALGAIQVLDAQQVRQLAAALQDQEPLVRKSVADALGALAPEGTAAIPALAGALNDDVNFVRFAAAEALGHFGEAALPELEKLLKSTDIYSRQAAITAMREMKPLPAAAVPVLIASLEDRNASVSDGAAGVLLQARIQGEWFTRYKAIQEERKLREKQKADRQEEAKLYIKEDIIASLPADENHKFPAQLESMTPLTGVNGVQLLVTLHRGKDRTDRVSIWKQVGDKYQRLKLMESPDESGIASFDEINPFRYQGYPFLQIRLLYSGTGGFVEENIFAINVDNTLTPVKMTDPVSKIALKPNEGVWKGIGSEFSDDKLEFGYYIWNEGDANCCPTAGKITGTYKMTKETKFDPSRGFFDEWTMSVDKAVREHVEK
jgi:HEAT repeat protein